MSRIKKLDSHFYWQILLLISPLRLLLYHQSLSAWWLWWIHPFHIDRNAPCLPPEFCITIVSNFSWVLQSSREKLETMVKQNLVGMQGALWSMWKWWLSSIFSPCLMGESHLNLPQTTGNEAASCFVLSGSLDKDKSVCCDWPCCWVMCLGCPHSTANPQNNWIFNQ